MRLLSRNNRPAGSVVVPRDRGVRDDRICAVDFLDVDMVDAADADCAGGCGGKTGVGSWNQSCPIDFDYRCSTSNLSGIDGQAASSVEKTASKRTKSRDSAQPGSTRMPVLGESQQHVEYLGQYRNAPALLRRRREEKMHLEAGDEVRKSRGRGILGIDRCDDQAGRNWVFHGYSNTVRDIMTLYSVCM